MDRRKYSSRIKYFPKGKQHVSSWTVDPLLKFLRRCGSISMTGTRILTLYIQSSIDTPLCFCFTRLSSSIRSRFACQALTNSSECTQTSPASTIRVIKPHARNHSLPRNYRLYDSRKEMPLTTWKRVSWVAIARLSDGEQMTHTNPSSSS